MSVFFVFLQIYSYICQKKKNSEFKPAKLRLKIDLVSYPARAEGLVNMCMSIFNFNPQIYHIAQIIQ